MRCSLCDKNECAEGVVCAPCEAHYASLREGHVRRQSLAVGSHELAHIAWSAVSTTQAKHKARDDSGSRFAFFSRRKTEVHPVEEEEAPPPPDWKNRVRPAPDGLPPLRDEDEAPAVAEAPAPWVEAPVEAPEAGDSPAADALQEAEAPLEALPPVETLPPPAASPAAESPPPAHSAVLSGFFESLATPESPNQPAPPPVADLPSTQGPEAEAPTDAPDPLSGFLASLALAPELPAEVAPAVAQAPESPPAWVAPELLAPPPAEAPTPIALEAPTPAVAPEPEPPAVDLAAFDVASLPALDWEAPATGLPSLGWESSPLTPLSVPEALPTLDWEGPSPLASPVGETAPTTPEIAPIWEAPLPSPTAHVLPMAPELAPNPVAQPAPEAEAAPSAMQAPYPEVETAPSASVGPIPLALEAPTLALEPESLTTPSPGPEALGGFFEGLAAAAAQGDAAKNQANEAAPLPAPQADLTDFFSGLGQSSVEGSPAAKDPLAGFFADLSLPTAAPATDAEEAPVANSLSWKLDQAFAAMAVPSPPPPPPQANEAPRWDAGFQVEGPRKESPSPKDNPSRGPSPFTIDLGASAPLPPAPPAAPSKPEGHGYKAPYTPSDDQAGSGFSFIQDDEKVLDLDQSAGLLEGLSFNRNPSPPSVGFNFSRSAAEDDEDEGKTIEL